MSRYSGGPLLVGLIADATGRRRVVPIADMAPLLDHLVGALLEVEGRVEAERLGGLEVDHQLELDRSAMQTAISTGMALV